MIRAFNEDLPYDEFLREPVRRGQTAAGCRMRWPLAALGFLTVGRKCNR